MLRERARVDRGRRDDQFEILAPREQRLQIAEQEVDVQAALVRFIENDRVVVRQVRIALRFRQQNAIGHQLDVGLRIRPVIKANLAADLPAPRHLQLLGNPARDGQGRHPTRLRATDLRLDAQPGFQAHLGNLRRLARARLACNHHDLAPANRRHDLVLAHGDRQVGRINDAREIHEPLPPQSDRRVNFLKEPVQQRVVPLGVMPIAQEADGARAQPHPVRQHGLGQQGFQFVETGVGHRRRRDRSERKRRWETDK